MLLGEGDRGAHGVIKGERVVNRGGRVVRVAGPVDLSALDHHEETLRPVGQKLDALLRVIGEREVICGAVHLVRHRHRILQRGVHRDDLSAAGLERGEIGLRVHVLVAGSLHELDDIGLVLFLALRLKKSAATKILETARRDLAGDIIVVAARGRLRVENRGRCVIERDGRDDADLHSLLVRVLGDRLELLRLRRVHVNDAVQGLVAARDRGAGRGGVGDERTCVIGRGETGNGKLRKAELFHGDVLRRERVGIHLGGADLRHRHSSPIKRNTYFAGFPAAAESLPAAKAAPVVYSRAATIAAKIIREKRERLIDIDYVSFVFELMPDPSKSDEGKMKKR